MGWKVNLSSLRFGGLFLISASAASTSKAAVKTYGCDIALQIIPCYNSQVKFPYRDGHENKRKSHFFHSLFGSTYLIHLDVGWKTAVGKLWPVACFSMANGKSIVFFFFFFAFLNSCKNHHHHHQQQKNQKCTHTLNQKKKNTWQIICGPRSINFYYLVLGRQFAISWYEWWGDQWA